jgi:hypothetical protein
MCVCFVRGAEKTDVQFERGRATRVRFARAGQYQRALVVAAGGGARYEAVEEAAAPLAARKDRAVHLSGSGGTLSDTFLAH